MKIKPMTLTTFLPIVFLSVALPVTAAEEATTSASQLAEQWNTAVKKALEKIREDKGGQQNPAADQAPYFLRQSAAAIKRAQTSGDTEALSQMIAQIQMLAAGEEIESLGEALLAQLEKENTEREQAALDAVNATVEKAVALCFSAQNPRELDATIIELSQFTTRGEYSSRQIAQRTSDKARKAVEFLCRWQDYLAQMKSGNVDAANGILVNLSKDTANYSFVPRSEILARIRKNDGSTEEEAAFRLPSLKGKTLADLEDLKQEMREMQAKNRGAQGVSEMLQGVMALDRAYEELSIGLVGQAFAYCTSNFNSNTGGDFLPLRQELLIQVLPPYLGVAKSHPVATGESPTNYLLRVIQDAREKREWMTLWKALETYRTVAYNNQSPSWLTAEITAASQFIVAQNLEQAGQLVDAIRTYKRVVGLAGNKEPIQAATEKLKVLEKESPEDFAAAAKPVEVPVSSRHPTGMPPIPPR